MIVRSSWAIALSTLYSKKHKNCIRPCRSLIQIFSCFRKAIHYRQWRRREVRLASMILDVGQLKVPTADGLTCQVELESCS